MIPLTLADAPLISAILAAALAVILRPRPAEGREIGPADSPEPEIDYLPTVVRALKVIGVSPVEVLKGVSIDVEDQTIFDLAAILPPGLWPAYEEARRAIAGRSLDGDPLIDGDPLMADLTGRIIEGADRGEPAMALLLAHLHRYGLGVREDIDRVYELTRLAAEAGDLVAASILGDMLLDGSGTLPDFGEAVVWLRRALPLGAAKTWLGLWYARLYRPDLVSQAEAVESLISAFSRGDAMAREIMDSGVAEQNFTIDDWRSLARDGDPEKSLILGLLLLFGQVKDRVEAEGLAALRQAARGRDYRAATHLARLYREGAAGLSKDRAEADKWASAAKRFEREGFMVGPRPGLHGWPGSWMAYEMRASPAGQAGQRKKPRKHKKAKKIPPGE